jgi:hypothetical protein
MFAEYFDLSAPCALPRSINCHAENLGMGVVHKSVQPPSKSLRQGPRRLGACCTRLTFPVFSQSRFLNVETGEEEEVV